MTVSRHNTNQRAVIDGMTKWPEDDDITPPRVNYVSNLERYWHAPRRRAGLYELSERTKQIVAEMRVVDKYEVNYTGRPDIRGTICLTLANRRYATHGQLDAAVRAAGGARGVRNTLRNMVLAGDVIAEGPAGHRTYSLPMEDD